MPLSNRASHGKDWRAYVQSWEHDESNPVYPTTGDLEEFWVPYLLPNSYFCIIWKTGRCQIKRFHHDSQIIANHLDISGLKIGTVRVNPLRQYRICEWDLKLRVCPKDKLPRAHWHQLNLSSTSHCKTVRRARPNSLRSQATRSRIKIQVPGRIYQSYQWPYQPESLKWHRNTGRLGKEHLVSCVRISTRPTPT